MKSKEKFGWYWTVPSWYGEARIETGLEGEADGKTDASVIVDEISNPDEADCFRN